MFNSWFSLWSWLGTSVIFSAVWPSIGLVGGDRAFSGIIAPVLAGLLVLAALGVIALMVNYHVYRRKQSALHRRVKRRERRELARRTDRAIAA